MAQLVEHPTLGFRAGGDLMGPETLPSTRLCAQPGVSLKIFFLPSNCTLMHSLSQIKNNSRKFPRIEELDFPD